MIEKRDLPSGLTIVSDLNYDEVSYRDELQALALQVADLERHNGRLKRELEEAQSRVRKVTADSHASRKEGSRSACQLCGGTLLPVAVFAGHDWNDPQPMSMSTLRFQSEKGGFTHAAPIHSLACTSCGYIHNFIEITDEVIEAATSSSVLKIPNGEK